MALKLSDMQLHWIVDHLMLDLEKAGLLQVVATDAEVKTALIQELRDNMDQEVQLERKARELLEKNLPALQKSGAQVDEHKAYTMIKKQLAQEAGFVL